MATLPLTSRVSATAPDYRYVLADGSVLGRSGVALAARRCARAVPRRSTRVGLTGTTTGSRCRRCGVRDLRAARRHVHAAGTFDAAIEQLDDLVDLGVTAVEPMPVAAFPGTRNWGYDGVFPVRGPGQLRRPAGVPALRRRVSSARSRRHSRRRLQPPRARRQRARLVRAVLHRRLLARRGVRRSTSPRPARTRCVATSPRTRSCGSATSTSTGCGLMRSTASSTRPRRRFCASSRRRSEGSRSISVDGCR